MKYDRIIVLYPTSLSLEKVHHRIQIEKNRNSNYLDLGKELYLITIDQKNFSEELGVNHIPLNLPNNLIVKRLLYIFKSIFVIKNLMEGSNNLLIGRMFSAGMVISPIAKLTNNHSVLYYQYDELKTNILGKNYFDIFCSYLMEKISLYFSKNIIATTDSLKERLLNTNFQDNISVIPNQVNLAIFSPKSQKIVREKLGIEIHKRVVLFVGRLESEKNIKSLLYAIKTLSDYKLIILGQGSMKNVIKDFSKQHGIDLLLKERIPHNELASYYNAADVFVLPSFTEGSPKVIIEAMACGCAIFASNIEEHKYLIEHGKNGLLFDPFRPKQLEFYLRNIFSYDLLYNTIKNNAYNASMNYSIESVKKKEFFLLLSLLQNGSVVSIDD